LTNSSCKVSVKVGLRVATTSWALLGKKATDTVLASGGMEAPVIEYTPQPLDIKARIARVNPVIKVN
jgi:hypothetical protein